MKRLILAASLVACTVSAEEKTNQADDILRVMLQGTSAPDMRELVERNGGEITHDLHIINAVGAVMRPDQLAKAIESERVTRYIDDLSVSDKEPDPEDGEPECEIGGSLDLQRADRSIHWKLFNKGTESAKLSELLFSWPTELGPLKSLHLGEIRLPNKPEGTTEDGDFRWSFSGDQRPAWTGVTTLRAEFQNSTEVHPQKSFHISAAFGQACKTSLIPGYENNEDDSYYPTAVNADVLHQHRITGEGVTVAVLDSGLWEHPSLKHNSRGQNRVVARFDAIANTSGDEVFDESGHGTHMTSVLAHSGAVKRDGVATGSFMGIAPDVGLVAIKAFNETGQGDFLDIVRGIQFAVDHREQYAIRVLNLSFAARPRWPYWLDPINQALMKAWDAGITVVAAAGNEGPDAMTIGSPGNLPYIITVGAITDSWTVKDRDDDYVPDFSSRGPTPSAHIKPDIVAPGGHISGITRPGSTLTREHPEYMLSDVQLVMTGTSQAAALVSGVAALLLQLEPKLTPDEIKCKLMSSAEPAINRDGLLAYSPFQQGSGYVSASRAVTLGETACGNKDLKLELDLSGEDHFIGPAIITEDGATSLPGLDRILSPEPAAKGHSESRKWGVKEHLERPDFTPQYEDSPDHPFNWEAIYEEERTRIERLSGSPN